MADTLGIGKLIENGKEVLKTVYPDLLQPATKQAGKALETVFELSNTILLPIKLVNVKAKLNFEKHMKKYEEKLNAHPQEEITTVLPDIGLPVIDRLTYLTNEEIADLFINFLVSASLNNSVNQAHPRFINILNSLSVDEAKLIKYFREKNQDYIPFIDYELHANKQKEPLTSLGYFPENQASIRLLMNSNNLKYELDLISEENINLYLENLESLGLLTRTTGRHIIEAKNTYTLIETHNRHELMDLEEEHTLRLKENYPNHEIITHKTYGFYVLTDLGEKFVSVCNKQ
ncbi:DUF4393 domain-containing protein [Bacillus thuringiensis]|uniref:DUF4393 domain-containing protein n=4 Tax=Bacillus thuringiensis TaxID=1428 RepID=UPI0007C19D9F|nr:DUF4393 domain-containing protein [Bacillus thuringiensis]AND11116.1 hypothetical protein Bt4C1_28415 [Bacillus thuringiensis serovar alesti]MEC3225462.1 DUF4393 domain-containing protein [Bacillus thuringiensis]MEC3556951.1 DUF4393 domain-containing protein [Bacillus thuringiensis]MEC3597913.1 DUF4393 domain-containing protein [Bacillus thuringiensis]MED1837317.1 DUF4393 domain-containing protein [Bacillus thuringiensis]